MYIMNTEQKFFEKELAGCGNRLEFVIRGNNSPTEFSVSVIDGAGREAMFSTKGGNYDFVFSDYRKRRVIIDFEGDTPQTNAGCDFTDIKRVRFSVLGEVSGNVYIDDIALCNKKSISAAWEERAKEIEGSYIMTQNEVSPEINCVNDALELKKLYEKLKSENGELGTDFIRAEGTRFVHQDGSEFIAIGSNYLGINIWEPDIFKNFSPEQLDEDFAIMEKMGFTTIRFAFTHHIWYDEADETKVSEECLLKIAVFLEIARKHNLRVILVGLDGHPPKRFENTDRLVDDEYIEMLEKRFEHTAAYFKDNPTILAWNIYNELTVSYDTPMMLAKWKEESGRDDIGESDEEIARYQEFRIEVAQRYIKKHTDAVRRGTQNHMVTCGTLQWSFPLIRPGDFEGYAAVNPRHFAQYVDFLCPHYYPIYCEHMLYPSENFHTNLQALRGWVNYCKVGKPILLEEFGSTGGGELWGIYYNQNQQLQFARAVIDTLAADVTGFIYWPFQDVPGSTDISQWSGLIDVEKNQKQLGAEYAYLINTADRTEYPQVEYSIDMKKCTTEKGSGGFGNYIRDSITKYISWLENKENDVIITEK